jgi:hypothetical protein
MSAMLSMMSSNATPKSSVNAQRALNHASGDRREAVAAVMT